MDNDNNILASSREEQTARNAQRNVCRDIDVFLVQCVRSKGFETRRQLFDWLLDLSKGLYHARSFEAAAWMSMASFQVHTFDFDLAKEGDDE